MDKINFYLCEMAGTFAACMVSVFIVFQYLEGRYQRAFRGRWLYRFMPILCCIFNFFALMFHRAAVSLTAWMLMILLWSGILYYSEMMDKRKYYCVNIVFILAVSVCESVGIMLVDTVVRLTDSQLSGEILDFLQKIAGAVTALFLYYVVLNRLFHSSKTVKIAVSQYLIYAIATIYVLINIGGLLFMTKQDLDGRETLFFMADLILLVFVNLYFFYVLDTFAENKALRYRVELYEAQAESNYHYYKKQEESYQTALAVMHDVKKHIRVMENLCSEGDSGKIQAYAGSMEQMLTPLLKTKYCDNVILNIILNDKKEYCERNGIVLEFSADGIQLDFMDAIDITTIYGNLLDNAVEACEKAEEKKVVLRIYPFHGFIFTHLSNSFAEKLQKDRRGKLISQKGRGHGIGLENVETAIKKYNGEMQYIQEKDWFTIELMLSKP